MRRREKQRKVIKELFEENESERKVLEANNISEKTFRRWLSDKYFVSTITNKIKKINLSNQILMARLLPAVTAKLIHLCSSDNEDVSRKACLTIMGLQKDADFSPKFEEESAPEMYDKETIAAIWKAIADYRERKRTEEQERQIQLRMQRQAANEHQKRD